MLINIKQNDTRFIKSIQDSGCLFLCFAQSSPAVFKGAYGINALNMLWGQAKELDYINENDEVTNHTGLNRMFGIYYNYDDKHHKASETIPDNVKLVFGKYRRENYTHFVIINKNKVVTFDPLGASRTVAEGYLEDMRWYYAD